MTLVKTTTVFKVRRVIIKHQTRTIIASKTYFILKCIVKHELKTLNVNIYNFFLNIYKNKYLKSI